MIKFRKSVLAALVAVAATSLAACNKKTADSEGSLVFWGSFGSKYSAKLESIVSDISSSLGYEIKYESKGSYPGIRKAVVDSIANIVYPTVAVGYPDHFAQYQGSGILRKLDDYVTSDMLADYDANYMPENYFYDKDGSKHLYGVPFNKSTELLGYNGVFVDYCDFLYPEEDLKNLPQTWDEWAAAKSNPTSKAGRYYSVFYSLVDAHAKLYATQDDDGTAHNFSLTPFDGGKLVLDYSGLNAEKPRNDVMFFTWDSTDNAFITMLRQFGGKYTELPESERTVTPKKRQGHILFAKEGANRTTTLNMLKYLNRMAKDEIFGTPADFGGNASFSSEAFSKGQCMFMICSSGGLSYNTNNWEKRFRLAPIPYKTADKKFVISQGANLCLTDNGPADKGFELIKKLTTGEFQTRWAIETGYFPASVSSSSSSAYQSFLNDTSYADPILVTYREGARVNETEYRAKNWNRFVDDAFIGSAVIREQIAFIIPNVLNAVSADKINDDNAYMTEINKILTSEVIRTNGNIVVD
jgi:ABC-type glycerol-3-phosphate transport system substrate-binding protein